MAARLAEAGHQIWLLDHRPERARFLQAHGLSLHDTQGQRFIPIRATADPARIRLVPLVMLCVKSAAAEGAVRAILPILGSDSLLIAFQNGITHHAPLTDLLPLWGVGVTAQGAHLLGPGAVRHGGFGPTVLGFLDGGDVLARQRLQGAADLLTEAGLATTLSPDILSVAWNKLIVNAGINALTALEDCANGELLVRPAALATLQAAVREAAQVAKATGIQVAADPVQLTIDVCRQTAANISSMLQDIRQRQPTEVEAINGAIVRQAAVCGVSVPTNLALLARVKGLEAGWKVGPTTP